MVTTTDLQSGRSIWQELETPTLDGIPDFYAQVLGWTFEQTGSGGVFRYAGEPVAGLRTVDPESTARAFWRVYLHSDALDEAVAYLTEHGGKVEESAVSLQLNSAEGTAVLDPFGAPFGLACLPDGQGAPNHLAEGRLTLVDAMTPDIDAAKSFCDGLFPAASRTHEEGDLWVYRGRAEVALFAINRLTDDELAYIRPHWLPWFGVPDADESGRAAARTGGRLLTTADFGYGHWVVVQDPGGGKCKALQAKVQRL